MSHTLEILKSFIAETLPYKNIFKLHSHNFKETYSPVFDFKYQRTVKE